LSGTPAAPSAHDEAAAPAGERASTGEIMAIRHNVDALQREVAELRSMLARVMDELGLSR
jgi:hypothetical protein